MNIYKPFIFQKEFLAQYTPAQEKEFSTICSRTGDTDFVPICSQFNHLEYFQQQAKDAYKKSYYATQKEATFHKYLLCWFNDMRAILYEHDITEQHFFKTN